MNFPVSGGLRPRRDSGRGRAALLPAAARFRPELVLISAGFDSRVGDPLGRFTLTDEDFADLTRAVMIAISSGGRVVSLLEGGYNLEGLASAAAAHVGALSRRFELPSRYQFGQADDLLLDRVLHQLRLVVDVQLAHKIELVRFHRLHAQIETAGDLLDRLPFGEHFEDFPFALGQGIEARLAVGPPRPWSGNRPPSASAGAGSGSCRRDALRGWR